MSNTAEALAALHAAEVELEAALAGEKSATASVSVSVAPASVSLGPEQIATAKEFLSRDPPPGPGVDPPTVPPPALLRTDGPTLEEYVAAGYPAENYPPAGYAARVVSTEKPKWLVLPGYLGPIAINGS